MSKPVTPPDADDIAPEDLPTTENNTTPSSDDLIGGICSSEACILRQWHAEEIIASLLAFDAASRQK